MLLCPLAPPSPLKGRYWNCWTLEGIFLAGFSWLRLSTLGQAIRGEGGAITHGSQVTASSLAVTLTPASTSIRSPTLTQGPATSMQVSLGSKGTCLLPPPLPPFPGRFGGRQLVPNNLPSRENVARLGSGPT